MPLLPPWSLSADPDGVWRWSPPAPEASLRPATGGLRYDRAGADGFLLESAKAERLRWELRLGEGTLLARLDPPLLVPSECRLCAWIAIPLARVLTLDGAAEGLDALRPDCRRAVLGPVDSGTVFPSVNTPLLSGHDDPALSPWTWAALRVRVHNRSNGALTLRRVPIQEPALALWVRGERVAAGDVHVSLEHDHRAEAHVTPGEPPPGNWLVKSTGARAAVPALSWLLDTTLRSVEFQP